MPDPSDPSGAYPINRVEGLGSARSIDHFARQSKERRQAEERRQAYGEELASTLATAVPRPTEPVRLNRRELYRTVYALARTEVELGESPDVIRAGFLEMAEEYKGMRDTIRRAIDDALDGREPRW